MEASTGAALRKLRIRLQLRQLLSTHSHQPLSPGLLPNPPRVASHLTTEVSMLRTAAVRALRAASRVPAFQYSTPIRTQIPTFLQTSRAATPFAIQSIRCYASSSGLSREEVQGRIMDLLKNFDKVTDASKVCHATQSLAVQREKCLRAGF